MIQRRIQVCLESLLTESGDKEALLGHPVLGASWEGYVTENLIALAPDRVEPSFYRTSGGAEIDLVLRWPEGQEWAIEVKRSLSPQPTRGMRSAIEDLDPERSFIVYPGKDRYPVGEKIEVVSLPDLAADLIARGG
jgi:predicted AAA+ superfamily ATPase